MEKLKGLDFFEQLFTSPQNVLVEKAMADGKIAVGYNCYVVPEVLLNAGNLFGVWMTAPGVESTPQADYYLSQVMCSYCKAVLEAGIDGTYDFLGATIFAPTCDHIRRSGQYFDILKLNNQNEKYFFYMIDAPSKQTDYCYDWYAKDMRKLADKFNEVYNANVTDETVRKAIKEYNEFNDLIRSIGDLRKAKDPKITGTEWAKIYGACKLAPKYLLIEPLKKIKAEIEARTPDNTDGKLRLMLIGSTFDKPEFTELIEAQGAIVVADRHCFGSLPGMERMDEEGDPFMALSHYYLDTCQCPRMMENGNARIDYNMNLIEEYSVDGAVFELMTFCDLWNYEGVTFLDAIKSKGMPYVSISREYSLTGEGQLRTRIQAFIESVNSKREQQALK